MPLVTSQKKQENDVVRMQGSRPFPAFSKGLRVTGIDVRPREDESLAKLQVPIKGGQMQGAHLSDMGPKTPHLPVAPLKWMQFHPTYAIASIFNEPLMNIDAYILALYNISI